MPNPPPSNDFSSIPPKRDCENEKMPDIPKNFLTPLAARNLHLDQIFNDNQASGGDESNNRLVVIGSDFDTSTSTPEKLEAAAIDDSTSASGDESEKFFQVKTLKTDFYEKPNGEIAVRLQPKPLDANTVSVFFEKDHFDIVFRTGDVKFLASHENCNEETRFRWTCRLSDLVKPEECRVRVQSLVEITLKKENPAKKWTSLCVIAEPTTSAATQNLDSTVGKIASTPRPASAAAAAVIKQESIPAPAIDYPTQSNSCALSKPTCKVPPYQEIGHSVVHGYTGLRNFGNTCFMNAPLQALINTRELRDYFLENYYQGEISRTNPLGFKGRLAEAFGQFVGEMWNGMNRFYEPSLLKELVGLKASQFANFAQHDAQEFLSFLLDGLHEDLNRVGDKKPMTPTVESDGRSDSVVADESWRYHRMRNDSFIVDLLHGQLKSRLDCPTCGHTSITFDPFVYLPVPFPKSRRPFTFYFWNTDPYAKPVKYTLSFVEDDSRVGDVFNRLSELINVKSKQLRMIEVFRQKVFKRYNVEDRLTLIRANDTIFVFQVYDSEEVGEDVCELTVVQRQLHPRMPVSYHCACCGKESNDLRACTKCRTAAYCDVSCQKNDWPLHHTRCRPPSPELVGQPFLISLPASKVTFRRLVQSLEARARHTVDVFQTPVVDHADNGDPSNESANLDGDNNRSEEKSQSDSTENRSGDETTEKEMVVNCGDRPTKRIRVVFGEPHQQPRSKPLFQLALTDEDGEYVLFEGKQKRFFKIDDDQIMDLDQNGACVAIDWINKKGKNCDHLVVLTKDDIDYAEEASAIGCANKDDQSLQLSELFEHFTETETLSADDAWYCGKCKDHRQAKKTLQLWRLPSVLIVQLKRFVYTSNIFRNKIDKHVVYPIREFDVRPYMGDGAAADEKVKSVYDLYAVVCHSGTSFFGHYTGMARLAHLDDPTKTDVEWRAFDDTYVTRVQLESHLVDGDAYFLFYKIRDEPAVELFDRYKSE